MAGLLTRVRNFSRDNNNPMNGGGVNEKIILKTYPKATECESGLDAIYSEWYTLACLCEQGN